MRDPREIIIRPLFTEKTMRQKEEANQVAFEVRRDANRIEIKEAVERLFKVKVLKVNTINVKGKPRRRGRTQGYSRSWKKALVTLRPGDRIEIFEGA